MFSTLGPDKLSFQKDREKICFAALSTLMGLRTAVEPVAPAVVEVGQGLGQGAHHASSRGHRHQSGKKRAVSRSGDIYWRNRSANRNGNRRYNKKVFELMVDMSDGNDLIDLENLSRLLSSLKATGFIVNHVHVSQCSLQTNDLALMVS